MTMSSAGNSNNTERPNAAGVKGGMLIMGWSLTQVWARCLRERHSQPFHRSVPRSGTGSMWTWGAAPGVLIGIERWRGKGGEGPTGQEGDRGVHLAPVIWVIRGGQGHTCVSLHGLFNKMARGVR